jgi:hypothetical protein
MAAAAAAAAAAVLEVVERAGTTAERQTKGRHTFQQGNAEQAAATPAVKRLGALSR